MTVQVGDLNESDSHPASRRLAAHLNGRAIGLVEAGRAKLHKYP